MTIYLKENRLKDLSFLAQELSLLSRLEEKLALLDRDDSVLSQVDQRRNFYQEIHQLVTLEQVVIKSLIAIDQIETIFKNFNRLPLHDARFRSLLNCLCDIEIFYSSIGGVVGYHVTVLELLQGKKEAGGVKEYKTPPYVSMRERAESIQEALIIGIRDLDQVGEIYPVGGAGDRLGLTSELSQEPLPAAMLQFCGKSLLEGLIRDVQAREHLHYKLFGKELVVPIAFMTSQEKNNRQHILELLQAKDWFGRDPNSFRFFDQPLVPVVTEDGVWLMQAELKLALKPGGHGVIWKLAQQNKVLDWFKSLKIEKVLIRQINNPIAGMDDGLSAFIGWGMMKHKQFGFLSCQRAVGSAEGSLVLIQEEKEEAIHYRICNLEYTNFASYGIVDQAVPGSPYSLYPTNTNILFGDIQFLEEQLKKNPIPGLLVNMKPALFIDESGNQKWVKAARLESMMQNIVDQIEDSFSFPLQEDELEEVLQTFILFNERDKTIATTKKMYTSGSSLLETPEGAYYTLLSNMRDLLVNYCQVTVPELGPLETSIEQDPPFICLFHPGLGPFYSIIAQKLHQGILHKGAELQIEMAEIDLKEFEISGSVLIEADAILGQMDDQGLLHYEKDAGRCLLHDVKFINQGWKKGTRQVWWKNNLVRDEAFVLKLHRNAEFVAEHVTFKGGFYIEVPSGYRMEAIQDEETGRIDFNLTDIHSPTWNWKYSINPDNSICLKK